jgi:F-type H+-transporting ATPase subunit b
VLIDWFTVIAQIVNFLILAGLLKYFLFDRIAKAMEEREQTIASTLEQADETRKLAHEEVERYARMNEELEESRRRTLDEARNEADSLRKALFQRARTELAEAKVAWEESLDREKKVLWLSA